MAAPFTQTSKTVYQDYQKALSPTALLGSNGAAFEAAQGSLKDALLERCLQAVKAKFPNVAPADALASIGADRGMPRGGSESDAAYAARLLNAWQIWPWAGTAFGLLQAFWSTGYRNVILAQVRGGKLFTLDQGGTNLLQWSADLGIAPWVKSNGGLGSLPVVTRNAAVAPDGTTTATQVVFALNGGTTINDFSALLQSVAVTPGTTHTFDVWMKVAAGSPAVALYNTDTHLTVTVTTSWQRFSISTAPGGSPKNFGLMLRGTWVTADSATVLLAYPHIEAATAAGVYVQSYGTAAPASIGAGALLSSSEGNGLWETDALSSLAPVNQAFWSKFDVVFPLPLMPPSWSWAGGIPSSSSTESNLIRALIQAWKPAHATCNRIVIVQQGRALGAPVRTVGASNGFVGATTTVWTP